MKLKTDYFYEAARENGISVKEYFEHLDCNFVIVEDGTPIVWESNNCPVIYGDKSDAKAEISQWGGDVTNVSIITEKEFIGRYCFDEYTKAIKDIAERENGDPTNWAYNIYKNEGGDATIEQFKVAVAYAKLDLSEYNDDDGDTLSVDISGAFADMFISHDVNFKNWYETLDEEDRFDAYGDILEMTPTMVISLCDKSNANEYYEKANAIRAKYSKYEQVMDTTNGHNEELVKQINDAWNKSKGSFKLILIALYERDIDEITDHDAFRIPHWEDTIQYEKGVVADDWSDYMEMALADMKEHWADYADNYLQHIADDTDLEAIIAFIHYPYLPIWK